MRWMSWARRWWCRWTPTSRTIPRTPAGCWRASVTDADVAIGSRYVAGGSVDQSWSWRRRQLSLWGNRLARWIAGLKGVRDCTAGFKAIRAAALRAAKVQEITVLGYAFQVALLHRLLHAGARVVEEPIHFRDRRARGDQAGPGEPAGVRLPHLVAAPDEPSHLHQVLRDGGERSARQPRLVPSAAGARPAPLSGLADRDRALHRLQLPDQQPLDVRRPGVGGRPSASVA